MLVSKVGVEWSRSDYYYEGVWLMATFNDTGKMIAIRVLPEVYNSLNLEISDINAFSGLRFQDKVVNKESMINATLVAFLSLEKKVRRKKLEVCLKIIEGMLASTEDKSEQDNARIHVPAHLEMPAEVVEEDQPKPLKKARK